MIIDTGNFGYRLILIIFLAGYGLLARAQEETSFGPTPIGVLWTGVEVQSELGDKIIARLEQQLRLNHPVPRFRSIFTDATIRYELRRWLRISGNYRWIIQVRELRHRVAANIHLRRRIDDWVITYRARLQHLVLKNELPENHLRHKLRCRYDLTKTIWPYLSTEWYYRIDHQGSQYDKYRIFAGLEYRLHKNRQVNLYYLFQREIQVIDPVQSSIVGVHYKHIFE